MPISKTAIDNNFHGFERVFIFMTNTNKACTHKNAIGGSDLINVRFGPLCGLKSGIPRGAIFCREQTPKDLRR